MSLNPYHSVDERALWKSIARSHFSDISDIYKPKFEVKKDDYWSSYGSCFAQNIGREIKSNGLNWLDCEPAPPSFTKKSKERYNYEVFPSRTNNIYTVKMLRQWLEISFLSKGAKLISIAHKGRFFDPIRQTVEPNGFLSEQELEQNLSITVDAFRRSIIECDIFTFTLGLTEAWINKENGYEYFMCPGTKVGQFDPALHIFKNYEYSEIFEDLTFCIDTIRSYNNNVKCILTVSPVPLAATYTNSHVMVATSYSKSILRAVTGSLASKFDFVDYFPSYELINSHVFKGVFFENNLRTISNFGVSFVMRHLFAAFNLPKNITFYREENFAARCDEEILESFRDENSSNR